LEENAVVDGFCVLSLDYSLAPGHPFPRAIHELSDLIGAVLEDNDLIRDLNLDTSRVALGGFSAGGNLTLALAQLPQIRDKVHALVTFYPRTDFSKPAEDNTEPKITPWGKVDPLPRSQPVFKWAYLPVGQDLHDPLLSPLYASRERIPHPIFMVTAEKDLVCEEGYMMARKMAGLDWDASSNRNTDKDRDRDTDGNRDEDADGNGEADNVTRPWSANGVRYMCAEGMPHCFTHHWEAVKGNEKWEKKRRESCERIRAEVGTWTRETLR
jgi:dienelactone hydrolase